MNFNQLNFSPIESEPDFDVVPDENAREAIAFFPNGYGVRVAFGLPFFKGDGIDTFEVFVLEKTDDDWVYLQFTDIADISAPFQTKDQVEEIIAQIKNFNPDGETN